MSLIPLTGSPSLALLHCQIHHRNIYGSSIYPLLTSSFKMTECIYAVKSSPRFWFEGSTGADVAFAVGAAAFLLCGRRFGFCFLGLSVLLGLDVDFEALVLVAGFVGCNCRVVEGKLASLTGIFPSCSRRKASVHGIRLQFASVACHPVDLKRPGSV